MLRHLTLALCLLVALATPAWGQTTQRVGPIGPSSPTVEDLTAVTLCLAPDQTCIDGHTLEVEGHIGVIRTATGNDSHGIEVTADAAGFGDFKALDIEYDTGAIETGEDEAVILVDINQLDATGGEVFALEVLSTDGGADAIYAFKAGAEVAPLLQDSGSFANPTTGTNNTTATDVADMIDGSTGTNTTIFVADNDYILIGAAAAFTEIEFVIETPVANPGIQPTFGYSTSGAHQFTTFSPIDGTNGFRNTGVVAWDASDLVSHTTNDDTGTFDIKIIRTHNSRGSASLFYAKTAATVVYTWDASGNLSVNAITSVRNVTASGATETLTSADCGSTTLLDDLAGSIVTLPASTGGGCTFHFVVTLTNTSSDHSILVVGTDEFVGGLASIGTTADQSDVFTAAPGADTDGIAMNGTTEGGILGTSITVQDSTSGNWSLWGTVHSTDASATMMVVGGVS